jgi:hypothetical protein
MKRAVLVLAACVGMIATSPAALASATTTRQGPPAISAVYRHDVVQRATPYSFCWTYTTAHGGYGICADGTSTFPRAATLHAPARVTVRVRSAEQPKHWSVTAGSKIRHYAGFDRLVGGRALPFRLAPHRVRGTITAWDLVLRLTRPDRDYYIETGGSFGSGKDAFYRLHLHT